MVLESWSRMLYRLILVRFVACRSVRDERVSAKGRVTSVAVGGRPMYGHVGHTVVLCQSSLLSHLYPLNAAG